MSDLADELNDIFGSFNQLIDYTSNREEYVARAILVQEQFVKLFEKLEKMAIDEEEMLLRVGFINPPPEAKINDRMTVVMSLPRHIMKKIEKQLEKYSFHGNHGQQMASYTVLCLILGSYFDDQEPNEEIIRTLASKFNFVSIEPDIKEVAEK